MDIKPFYELRTRLYLSAAAGCSVISEDFRLKRALENFKPLSEANKVFGKLYLMCEKLFSSENPAPQIADCIALADALAVTQGTFADSSETEPSQNEFSENFSLTTPYSYIEPFINSVEKGNLSPDNIRFADTKFIDDPRVLAAFISKAGSNSVYISALAKTICRRYGKKIVPLLKKSIDLSNPKETGNQVEYICSISGTEENEWYTELAQDEENPQGVRIQAIKAMALSDKNTSALMEMYHTQKGKIKNTVTSSLALIDPPEAEPIWIKMTESTEKFKKTSAEYIKLSENKICSDFAQKYVCCILEKMKSDNSGTNVKSELLLADAAEMLENKADAEECILKVSDFCKNSVKYTGAEKVLDRLAYMMADNVKNHPENPAYKELVHNLYRKDPETFFSSEFLVNLQKDPDDLSDTLENISIKNRISILHILHNIIFSAADNTYYINWNKNLPYCCKDSVPVFKSIPESVLKLIADTSFREKNKNSAPVFKGILKLISGTSFREEPSDLSSLCEDTSALLVHLLKNRLCSSQDAERIKKYAAEFVFSTAHEFPNVYNIDLLSGYISNEDPEKYKDIVYDYVCWFTRDNKPHYSIAFVLNYFEKFPLSDKDKLSELKKIKKVYEDFLKNSKYPSRGKYDLISIDNTISKYSGKES